MNAILGFFVWLAMAGIALAQEAAPAMADAAANLAVLQTEVTPDPLTYIMRALSERWPWLVQIGVMAVIFQGILRGIAELLLLISAKTENATMNKIAVFVSEASWYLGVFIGKAGWGTPKAVVVEKAKEIANGGAAAPAASEPKAG
jgi:hypothetical protein